jgi:hypothetical protein
LRDQDRPFGRLEQIAHRVRGRRSKPPVDRTEALKRAALPARITVRRTGVFVGAGFAPAAARLHPEDRGRDAGALVFECRFAGAAANSVEQKVSDL